MSSILGLEWCFCGKRDGVIMKSGSGEGLGKAADLHWQGFIKRSHLYFRFASPTHILSLHFFCSKNLLYSEFQNVIDITELIHCMGHQTTKVSFQEFNDVVCYIISSRQLFHLSISILIKNVLTVEKVYLSKICINCIFNTD